MSLFALAKAIKPRLRKKQMKAWADLGSHGGIFVFEIGPTADIYPRLLHIYEKQVTPDLVPVEIAYEIPDTSETE